MKSNKKKKITKSKLVFLFIIIALIPSGFILPFNTRNNFSKELNPTSSVSDFDDATKIVARGYQEGTFNEDNIRDDDEILDSTGFEVGSSNFHTKDDPTYFFGGNGIHWGTNVGGIGATWDIANALRTVNPAVNNLWMQAQWGINYPLAAPGKGWVWMRWGGYSNLLDTAAHAHIYQIRIIYGIWVDYLFPTGLSKDLRLWAITSDAEPIVAIQTIDTDPGDLEYVAGVMTITSATNPSLMDSIVNGAYIKDLAVDLDMSGEIGPANVYTWINVDFINIVYDFYKYDVEFIYELDFGSYPMTSITKFDIKIDITETVPGLNVYLYNFGTAQYDKILTFDSAGIKTKTISINADDYFNVDQEVHVRFERENFVDVNPSNSYFIRIDQVLIDLNKPDPPSNVIVTQGILHINLTWDMPNDYGLPITHYNVYRGETEGGIKSLIASPTTNELSDTAIVPETMYYYTITAVNSIGESDNSTEVSGKGFNQPFVEWITPEEDVTIVFGTGAVVFNFTYDAGFVDDVELIINETGPYDVTGLDSLTLVWSDAIRGIVNATLLGYNNTVLVSQDSRFFNFVRIIYERVDTLEEKTKSIGEELYLILHDPNGDNSFSGFPETTRFSIGVGAQVTEGVPDQMNLDLEEDFSLFNLGTGGSTKITEKTTIENGFDFRFELSSTTGLTSKLESTVPDYIGPGYGDIYWGESWTFNYKIMAHYRIYSNGTDRYEEPKLYWGLIRDTEVILNDDNAPSDWRDMNPVYDNWNDVVWDSQISVDGGLEYLGIMEISSTNTTYKTFEIQTEQATRDIFVGLNETVIIEISKKNYVEEGSSHVFEANFTVLDDEPSDTIVQMVGIDHRFGTYIFKTNSTLSQSCNPLEHNTNDYIPPEIEVPNIVYDSNGDLQCPCFDDTPIVTVELFDEGVIQEALIMYSIDNGTTWSSVPLFEQANNPGTWEGVIPAQAQNTTVLWYILAEDGTGNNATRKDYNTGDPFSYLVVKKFEEVPEIPSYPLMVLIPIVLVSVISIVSINYRKHYKLKK